MISYKGVFRYDAWHVNDSEKQGSAMRRAKQVAFALCMLFMTYSFVMPAFAQDSSDDEIRNESAIATGNLEAPKEIARQSWCLLTVRFEYGIAKGRIQGDWLKEDEACQGDNDDGWPATPCHYPDKMAHLRSINHYSLKPEIFFMPLNDRHVTFSVSLPFSEGNGTIDGHKFDNDEFRYQHTLFKLGLGILWPNNPEHRSNLIVMTHYGRGNYWMYIEGTEDKKASKTLTLRAWELDMMVLGYYRFDNRFILGGSFEPWLLDVKGNIGKQEYWRGDSWGQIQGIRAGVMAGYAL